MVPSAGPAWVTDLLLGDHYGGGGGAAMAAIAGTPSITVPMGESHGLPLGLALMGAAYSEAQLIGLAYAFEQASQCAHPAEIFRDTPRHDGRCEGRRCALTTCASVAFGR